MTRREHGWGSGELPANGWVGTFTVLLLQAPWVLLLVISGCGAQLPDYARPAEMVEPASHKTLPHLPAGDLIAYRSLVRADFLAEQPPRQMQPYAERMGAVTCAKLLTLPEPQYFVQQVEGGFSGGYLALGFAARMDRDCSWWNRHDGEIPTDYVLQHEQIHFALAELAARKLNSRARKLRGEQVAAPTAQRVHEQLHDLVQNMLDREMEALLRENTRFDRATSSKFAPQVQQRWFDRVQQQLARSP